MANPTVTIVGRIGQDPDTINYASGTGLKLRVATQDRVKNDSGNWEDKDTSWWTVKVWGKLAEQAKDVLKKGQEVTIVGKMREEQWTDNAGNKRYTTDIKAENISVSVYTLQKNLVGTSSSDDIWNAEGDTPF
jgi:single-strand DNA-binding protein